jgi:hypothetical protein
MKHKLVRIAIGVPEAFIALSAIGVASPCCSARTRMAS